MLITDAIMTTESKGWRFECKERATPTGVVTSFGYWYATSVAIVMIIMAIGLFSWMAYLHTAHPHLVQNPNQSLWLVGPVLFIMVLIACIPAVYAQKYKTFAIGYGIIAILHHAVSAIYLSN